MLFNQRTKLRNFIQIIFALITLYIGVKFILFVNNALNPGALPKVSRPAGVEAFLPISALVSFKAWLSTGVFDKIHPAGLIIFLAAVVLSLLFKKAFCAWLCPFGTLSEGLAKLGKFFFGRNFKVPRILDYLLRSLKYLLLSFFFFIVVFGMSGDQAAEFLQSPYNMIADVKMLQFFQSLSGIAFLALGTILLLSILVENFWCRYLCPYGALMGLISFVSPWKVTRNQDSCLECGACTVACPNRIEVAKAARVWSPECNGCQNCINSCPAENALAFKSRVGLTLSPKLVALCVVITWLMFVVVAKLTGHWETAITSDMYNRLIPMSDMFGH